MNLNPSHPAVLLAAIFAVASSASIPQQFGSCNMSEMVDRTTTCENGFIGTMAGNADASCSREYDKLEGCFMAHVRGCFVDHMNPAMLNHTLTMMAEFLTLLGSEQFFCTDQTLSLEQIPMLVPCRKEFFKESTKCSGSFRTKFIKDRTDTSLCREYDKAKECSYNLTLRFCDDMGAKRDDYNPFCADRDKEPVALASGATTGGVAGRLDNNSFTTGNYKPSTADNKREDDTSAADKTAASTIITLAVMFGLVCIAFA